MRRLGRLSWSFVDGFRQIGDTRAYGSPKNNASVASRKWIRSDLDRDNTYFGWGQGKDSGDNRDTNLLSITQSNEYAMQITTLECGSPFLRWIHREDRRAIRPCQSKRVNRGIDWPSITGMNQIMLGLGEITGLRPRLYNML
ncbi:unnamed protein product [Arabis nemorensis]|uniref:Uncharacterized protein n=1 Tax=Arabis nemorensis TaxID=586526 RepID=A0A565CPC2_9BRAS|nr:unnamed protein product [Arabis nemorensis]